MACSNCFNGCAGITSDQCVKYTGLSIPALGITNGDPLSKVEEQLTTYLVSVLDGTGIYPTFNADIVCPTIAALFAEYTNPNVVDVLSILIRAACSLQTQIDAAVADIATIEADYTVDCLAGVTPSSGTHDILQATITKLCSVNTSLGALALNLSTNYSSNGAQLDAYIANYLSSHTPTSTLISNKMVPYVAYPFFGDLTGKFDANGVGIVGTDWEKIYLCNNYSGLTPDLRGRIPVGATTMATATTDPATIAGGNGGLNPAWDASVVGAWTKSGSNAITLSESQMPIHTHTPTITLTNPTHTHYTVLNAEPITNLTSSTPIKWGAALGGNSTYELRGVNGVANIGVTSPASANVSVASQTNSNTGGGLAHSNVQPGIACYYIMYIP